MYRSARMWRSALVGAALALATSCAPKQVQSPLEKAPPQEIAEARELADSGDIRSAQNAYEKFIIEHPGTTEADLASLERGVLSAELGRCEIALPYFEQAEGSTDRAISLRASLHLASCQLSLGDPDRALTSLEPLTGQRFSSDEQALLWETALSASEQTTNGALGLQVLDALIARGGAPPDPSTCLVGCRDPGTEDHPRRGR